MQRVWQLLRHGLRRFDLNEKYKILPYLVNLASAERLERKFDRVIFCLSWSTCELLQNIINWKVGTPIAHFLDLRRFAPCLPALLNTLRIFAAKRLSFFHFLAVALPPRLPACFAVSFLGIFTHP